MFNDELHTGEAIFLSGPSYRFTMQQYMHLHNDTNIMYRMCILLNNCYFHETLHACVYSYAPTPKPTQLLLTPPRPGIEPGFSA